MRFVLAIGLCAMLAGCITTTRELPPEDSTAYLIVFQGDATEFAPRVAAVINNVAAAANRHQEKAVELAVSAAPDSSAADLRLLEFRTLAIEHGLAAAGVDEQRIVRTPAPPLGEDIDDPDTQQVKIRLIDAPPPQPPSPTPEKHRSKAQKSKN